MGPPAAEMRFTPFPERRLETKDGPLDRAARSLHGIIAARFLAGRAALRSRAHAVMLLETEIAALASPAMTAAATELRQLLRGRKPDPFAITKAFALVREATWRQFGFRHHPSQLMGGFALLDGRMVEMATGEGKTVTALLAAVVQALAGRRVHVITANEYLAERDRDGLAPIFELFDISVGLIRPDSSREERRTAYACDVTYCTAKDVVFDYLRDRIALGRRRKRAEWLIGRAFGDAPDNCVLRGLDCAIIDEADNTLIDEAGLPLIISGSTDDAVPEEVYQKILVFAGGLGPQEDFRIEEAGRRVVLTDRGRAQLDAVAEWLPSPWSALKACEHLTIQALQALHLFARDVHYFVADDKVQIIDDFTGRAMPDRTWSLGLHQFIEFKEGLPTSQERRTAAQLTFQRFFPRYRHLSGMSGTVLEVAGEISRVYGLRTIRIPIAQPSGLQHRGTRLLPTETAKWAAVAERAAQLASTEKRPVLIGTRSVAASERISAALAARGQPHEVLSARQNSDEAIRVRMAGEAGRITIATNIAGRGTDIPVSDHVASMGGLHVILTEFNEARRIDRQLYGRTARKGQAGSCEAIVSLEDDLFRRYLASFLVNAGQHLPQAVLTRLGDALRQRAQTRAERRSAMLRGIAQEADRRHEQSLAFAGQE